MKVNPPVFFISAALLILFLAYGIVFTEQAATLFPAILAWVSSAGGWLYVASIAGFLAFAVWLLFSRYGDIPLGPDGEPPTFRLMSWFAMLFSAGVGIGMVFYGVAEPILHYTALPGTGAPSPASAAAAVPVTVFHWGFHPWAAYLLVGLAMAYFSFRKGLPLALRSCLYPWLGERVHGPIGHAVDILAVFGTLFGLATSLGLGAMQISAGLERVFGIQHGIQTQLLLILVITLAAMISLVTGVNRGIRRLSELNLILCALLAVFVFAVGPTGEILAGLAANATGYASEIASRTFAFDLLQGESAEWSRAWTIFYWGWWIAWAPFVGTFVARISRGRTIREFVLGVLVVPTAVALVWFTVFGDTALQLEQSTGGIAAAVSNDPATAIYVVLDRLPLPAMTSVLTTAVVAVFFITSSDSASLVVDMLTSGGDPNPPTWQRVFWASAEGACAAVLLYAGGERALQALQAVVVSIGLPVCLIMIAMAANLFVALRREGAVG